MSDTAGRRPGARKEVGAVRTEPAPGDDIACQGLPFVSVVVPVRNEAATIGRTLAAVLAGDYPESAMEVLVVDGGSTDLTVGIVEEAARRDARIRLLRNPSCTAPAGLNAGIRAARGQIVVRLDGHTMPDRRYVRACVDALGRTRAWCVGGALVGYGDTPFGEAVALASRTRFGAGDASFRLGGAGAVDTVYLGAWPRAVFDTVGLFDEDLPRNQDYELCFRIREAGGTVWLDPAIRSVALVRGSPPALARQYFDYGRGRAATVIRHPRSLRARQAVPALCFAALAGGLAAAALSPAGRRVLAAMVAAYAAANAASTVAVARRRGARHGRSVALAYATMHFAWAAGFWAGLLRGIARRPVAGKPSARDAAEEART